MTVRERMKFFQGGKAGHHHENHHLGHKHESDLEQINEHESGHHYETASEIEEEDYVPKTRVKRNISLLIQELTHGH